MLQSIRDHMSGWLAGVIIGLVSLGFIVWGLEYYIQQGSGENTTVAKVDGQKITKRELDQAYQRVRAQAQAANPGQPLNQQQTAQLRHYALQNLINSVAMHQYTNRIGMRVSNSQVQQLIERAPEFQQNGRFSPQRFQRLLYMNQMTEQQFVANMRNSLALSQLEIGLMASDFVLPAEMAKAYSLLKQQRHIGYFILPAARFKSKVTVTDKQIQDYYNNNKNQFKTTARVKVNYLLLAPSKMGIKVSVTDADINNYYQANQMNFTIPKRWQVSQIVLTQNAQKEMEKLQQQLKNGKTFAALMKENIPGMQATTRWLSAVEVSDALAAKLSALNKGQVTAPFKTQNGMAMLQLVGFEPAKTRPLSEVKAGIEKTVRQQKIEKLMSDKASQLANLTYTNPKSLEPAAKALGLTVQHSGWLTQAGEKTGVFADQALLSVIFSEEVMKSGENSNPVTLKNGEQVVLRVVDNQPSKQQPLAQVRNTIKQTLTTSIAERQAGLAAYQIQTALAKGASPSTLASKYNVTWKTVSNLQADNKTLPQSLVQKAFALSASNQSNSAGSTLVKGGDYAIIKLLKVQPADIKNASAKEKQALQHELLKLDGVLTFRLYTTSVLKDTKVKVIKGE